MNKVIAHYLAKANGLPMFCAVNDSTYLSVLNELTQFGLIELRASDFCSKADKFPDLDQLVDYIYTGDVNYKENKFVVTGVGEYLALRGKEEIEKSLLRLKNVTLGNARVVFLLRGITPYVKQLFVSDPRIVDQYRGIILGDESCNVSIINNSYLAAKGKGDGFKALLCLLENGETGIVNASTGMLLKSSIFPIKTIASSYDAVDYLLEKKHLPKSLGESLFWDKFADELYKYASLTKIFNNYNFDLAHLSEDFYSALNGLDYRNWLYYIFLYTNKDKLQNTYLQYVLNKNLPFNQFKKSLVTEILQINFKAEDYSRFYKDRKQLLNKYSDVDMAEFIAEAEAIADKAIYYYTDNTKAERQAIITWISRYGINSAIENIYPALWHYLDHYVFTDEAIGKELTEYFDLYKKQKVQNRIDPGFLSLVEEYANKQLYASLNTRDNEVNSIQNKDSTMLYWIDALGVEYLSFISYLAKKHGLSLHVEIGRADLPTITVFNKGFYENWSGPKKQKTSLLDDVKHKEEGGFYYTKCEFPIHLEEELNIIEKVVSYAAHELLQHKYKSFAIASDHGASRLAVIAQQEEKYETDTKGEHSGRCCKAFPNCDLVYKIEENGYYVLTNYGRFKYSRAANVEVHGGASLEEVIVPLIVLKLKADKPNITLIGKDAIFADRHNGTTIKLYISGEPSDSYILRMNDKVYYSSTCINSTYTFILDDIKRARKNCSATLYDGQDSLEEIVFDVQSKIGGTNTGFDDLF